MSQQRFTLETLIEAKRVLDENAAKEPEETFIFISEKQYEILTEDPGLFERMRQEVEGLSWRIAGRPFGGFRKSEKMPIPEPPPSLLTRLRRWWK